MEDLTLRRWPAALCQVSRSSMSFLSLPALPAPRQSSLVDWSAPISSPTGPATGFTPPGALLSDNNQAPEVLRMLSISGDGMQLSLAEKGDSGHSQAPWRPLRAFCCKFFFVKAKWSLRGRGNFARLKNQLCNIQVSDFSTCKTQPIKTL